MNHSVLIVDDSKLARMLTKNTVASLRPTWRLSEADGADQAIKALEGGCPDVVLIDFNMPGRTGFEVAAEIRNTCPDVLMAMISANSQREVIARAHALGMEFVSKPLKARALENLFNRLDGCVPCGK